MPDLTDAELRTALAHIRNAYRDQGIQFRDLADWATDLANQNEHTEAVLDAILTGGIVDNPNPIPPVKTVELAPYEPMITGPKTGISGRDLTGEQIGGLFNYVPRGQPMPSGNGGWPNYTRPQGQYDTGWAKIVGSREGMLLVEMERDGHLNHSATTEFQQHLLFGWAEKSDLVGHAGAYFQARFAIDNARFRTLKLGGLVGFNDQANDRWNRWPGGLAHPGSRNFSVRAVVNWDDNQARPCLSLYLYLGADLDVTKLQIDGTATPRVELSNRLRTVEVVARNGPPIVADVDYVFRIEADNRSGRPRHARLLLAEAGAPSNRSYQWEEVMRLSGFTWATEGAALFTRAYPQLMFGGRDLSFAPHDGSNPVASTVRYGHIAAGRLID